MGMNFDRLDSAQKKAVEAKVADWWRDHSLAYHTELKWQNLDKKPEDYFEEMREEIAGNPTKLAEAIQQQSSWASRRGGGNRPAFLSV